MPAINLVDRGFAPRGHGLMISEQHGNRQTLFNIFLMNVTAPTPAGSSHSTLPRLWLLLERKYLKRRRL